MSTAFFHELEWEDVKTYSVVLSSTTYVRGRRGGAQSLVDGSRNQAMTNHIPSLVPSPSPFSTSCSEGSPFHRAIIAVLLGTLTTSDRNNALRCAAHCWRCADATTYRTRHFRALMPGRVCVLFSPQKQSQPPPALHADGAGEKAISPGRTSVSRPDVQR